MSTQATEMFVLRLGPEKEDTALDASCVHVTQSESEVTRERDDLVEMAKEIETVSGESSQKSAVETIRKLKIVGDKIEKAREAAKRPILLIGKKIDEDAKKMRESIDTELKRLGGLVNTFTTAQYQKAQREEQKRLEDARRLEQERRAAATPQEAAQIAQQQRTVLAAPVSAPVKVEGTATQNQPMWDLVDIQQLYAARPDLCNAPTINLVALKKAIIDGLTECAGLENIRIEKKLSVR